MFQSQLHMHFRLARPRVKVHVTFLTKVVNILVNFYFILSFNFYYTININDIKSRIRQYLLK